MDTPYIFSFLNSKAIRDHFEAINFQPSAVQSTWIILNSMYATFEDKTCALNHILDTTADEAFPDNHLCRGEFQTLHEYIQKKLAYDQEFLSHRYDSCDDAIYQFQYLYFNHNFYDNLSDSVMFRSLKECQNAVVEDLKSYTPDDIQSDDIRFYIIRQRTFGNKSYTEYKFNLKHQLISYDQCYLSDKESDIFLNLNEGISSAWMIFPLPFKPGDILYDVTGRVEDPIVLTSTTLDRIQERPDYKGCDDSDMNVLGYQLTEDGRIIHEVWWNYMNYDYYPEEELVGTKRVLKLIRSMLQENRPPSSNIEFFTTMYRHILLEDQLQHSGIGWFMDDYVKKFDVDPKKYKN